jgi:hypothetical protein
MNAYAPGASTTRISGTRWLLRSSRLLSGNILGSGKMLRVLSRSQSASLSCRWTRSPVVWLICIVTGISCSRPFAIYAVKARAKLMLDALQSEIEEVTADIDRAYNFLTMPKIKSSPYGDGLVRAIVRVHEPDQFGEYVFCAPKQPSPNHLKYLGFHCPRCEASVMRLKQTVAFGRGFERMVVQSCHCMFLAVMCPKDGPGRLRPLTREIWQKYFEETPDGRQGSTAFSSTASAGKCSWTSSV